MLTPRGVICLAISDGKVGAVAVPPKRRHLVIIVQANDAVFPLHWLNNYLLLLRCLLLGLIIPVVKVIVLLVGNPLVSGALRVAHLLQRLLDSAVGLYKVELRAQTVRLVDVFALFLPQRLIIVKSLDLGVRFQHFQHFRLDRLQEGLQASHICLFEHLLFLLLVLFQFCLGIFFLVVILVVIFPLGLPDFADVGRVLLSLHLHIVKSIQKD